MNFYKTMIYITDEFNFVKDINYFKRLKYFKFITNLKICML